MATLWAWATPAPFAHSPIDQTWITDYDTRGAPFPTIGAVIAASMNHWFCWGPFHPQSEGSRASISDLGRQEGRTPHALCLCASNAPSGANRASAGAVRIYGVDGISHQLANQVLWATGSTAAKPLTVSRARGYGASLFFYGSYGLRHGAWEQRRAQCSGTFAPRRPAGAANADAAPTADDDEFGTNAASVLALGGNASRLRPLLALRRQAQERLIAAPAGGHASAQALHRVHQVHLLRAAGLLDDEDFRAIFGFASADLADAYLIDPRQAGPATP